MTQAGGLDDYGPNASIDRLLLLLSSLSGESKRRGISAAIKAVLAQQEVGLVRRGLLTHGLRWRRLRPTRCPGLP